ncbi:hypothetical protein, partial [Halomonas sp.]|uniref:hypothetical protein n=1 Tax=Halomonas sp. TaxID=1486246 RepID=UPI0025BD260E
RPVRPVDMPTAGFHVSYNMEDTVSLSHSEIPESGYNAVQVMGQTSEYDFPILQVEEVKTDGELDEHGMPPTRRPYRGETTYVRVFWGGEPRNVVDSYSTDGSIEVVGGGVFYSEERIETVHFEDGLGRVSLPVEDLISWEWVGDSASSVNYTRHSMELKIPDTKFRIAVVKYKILFQRYMLTGHDVEQLIAVLFLESKPDVFMKIRTAQDPVYGSSIEDALLSDEAAAVVRGTSWIDQQYRKSLIRLSAPYKEEALDGRIAYINDARIGSPGNYHIQKSVISINGPVVKNEIEVEKCLTLFNL